MISYEPRFSTFAESCGADATLIAVADPDLFARDDIVMNTVTGEMMRVREVVAGSLFVQRAIVSDAVPVVCGHELLVTGSAALSE